MHEIFQMAILVKPIHRKQPSLQNHVNKKTEHLNAQDFGWLCTSQNIQNWNGPARNTKSNSQVNGPYEDHNYLVVISTML